MTITYFPFDSGAGANITEVQWKKMAQNWLGSGVIRGELDELQPFGDSTGLQVKVKSGVAWIKGHYFENDEIVYLPVANNSTGNPRIDRIIVRVDWVANLVEFAVLQGVTAASPVPPALTQNTGRWEISLAQIRVNAGVSTIASGNVTDERAFAGDFKQLFYTDSFDDKKVFSSLESSVDGKLKEIVTSADGSTKTITEKTADGVINYPSQSLVYVRRTTSLTVPSGVDTKITFDSVVNDVQSEFSLSTNGFTPKEGGNYLMHFQVIWSTTPTSDISLKLFTGGASWKSNTIGSADKINNFSRTINDFTPGQRYDFYINQGTSEAVLSQINVFISKIA